MELIVNLPPQLNNSAELIVCDNATQTANLNDILPLIMNPLPAGSITGFYETIADATNDINEISSTYNYTTNNTTLVIRVEDTSSSCFSTASFNLRIQAPPQIAALGTYDLRDCDDDFDGDLSFDLSNNSNAILNGLDTTTHTLQYFSTEIDAENDSNELIDTNVIVNQSETFFVRVTNTVLGCISIGEFEVIVDPLPLVTVDPFQVICNGGFVNVNASTGNSGERFLWSTGETTSAINITIPGDYTVQVTSNRGCVSPTRSFTVTESETANVDFVASTNFENPNTIVVSVNGIGDYLYILDNGPAQVSNIFTNVSRGFHEVRVIDLNGCEPTPPQIVLIIDYPRFFTPNNDGFNDTWYVDGIDTFDQATFYIFDRHGKLLKNFGKDFNGWDGTYNGNPLPSSDYWFTLEVRDSRGNYDVKGHFTLKR